MAPNMAKEEVLALITARGGSKGVPRKNLKPVAGRPLIAWTIQAARGARRVDRVVVSTDDAAIAEVAKAWGASAPFLRPAELASDQATSREVALHALDWLALRQGYQPDWLLLLQPTSPLRLAEDIDRAVDLARASGARAVVSVCPAHPHPQWCQRLDETGRLHPWVEGNGLAQRRQDLPPAYALNGAIYLVRAQDLMAGGDWLGPDTLAYLMPAERSLDIDSPWDLHLADLVLSHIHGHGDD